MHQSGQADAELLAETHRIEAHLCMRASAAWARTSCRMQAMAGLALLQQHQQARAVSQVN
jgi:hypothetical protein